MPLPSRSRILGLFCFATLFVGMLGCAPKKAEPDESRPIPTATPSTRPFTILYEIPKDTEVLLQSTMERSLKVPAGWHLNWKPFESTAGAWDLALVAPQSLSLLAPNALDLTNILDSVFPLHKADFIVAASDFTQEGQMTGVPVLFLPHFLFAKDESIATPEGLQRFLSEGHKVALPSGEAGKRYQSLFEIPPEGAQWLEPGEDESAFLNGSVEAAIADRSWLAKGRIPPTQVFSLSGLDPESTVPDWGVRLSISKSSANTDFAKEILRSLLVDLQEKLIGAGGGVFPVRRSVYQSPRIQGAFFGAPKSVFDSTLENLRTPQ